MKRPIADYSEEEFDVAFDRSNARKLNDLFRLKRLFENKAFRDALCSLIGVNYNYGSKEWLLKSFISMTGEAVMYYYYREEIREALQGINNPCKEVFLKHFR